MKKKNLLDARDAKMSEGMASNHSMYMTKEKAEELEGLPRYYCTLNYVKKNSTAEKKVRPTSNFSAPHVSGSFNLLAINGPSILNSAKTFLTRLGYFNVTTILFYFILFYFINFFKIG